MPVTPADESIPKWDVALEALLRETCQKKGAPLDVHDVFRLSQEYRIRFDDLMTTLFELTLYDRWQYRDEDGHIRKMSHGELERVRGTGRLDQQDLARLVGRWEPLWPIARLT